MEPRDSLNRPLCNENTAIELLLRNQDLYSAYYVDSQEILKQISHAHELEFDPVKLLMDQPQQDYHKWMVPEHYLDIDVEQYLWDKCPDCKIRQHRVQQELEMFKARNLYNVLRLMIYIVDTMRRTNTVWGVGRGSSVSSYCLYLLGVHKIDSVKYNLDINEFLR